MQEEKSKALKWYGVAEKWSQKSEGILDQGTEAL